MLAPVETSSVGCMATTPATAARSLIARAERELQDRDRYFGRLRQRLPEAAAALRSEFGAGRVVLFGSVAWGGIHAHSDVDLAVDGVAEHVAGAAEARVAELVGQAVEVVRLEALPDDFAARVLRDGEAL